MANQWERAVVLRLGKLHSIRGPGMFTVIPFIDAVATWLDNRIQPIAVRVEKISAREQNILWRKGKGENGIVQTAAERQPRACARIPFRHMRSRNLTRLRKNSARVHRT